jgi:hypothetical protein
LVSKKVWRSDQALGELPAGGKIAASARMGHLPNRSDAADFGPLGRQAKIGIVGPESQTIFRP